MGIPWEGFFHDMSKFLHDEFFPYAKYNFNNKKANTITAEENFNMAWAKHQKRNKHHWAYWVFFGYSQHDTVGTMPIPHRYLKEMVADWVGAGKAYGKPDPLGWYKRHGEHMILHPQSRRELEQLLSGIRIKELECS